MNTFEINGTALRDGWGGADRFWFSLKDYKLRDAAAMAQIDRPDQISQSAYFVSIGYILISIFTSKFTAIEMDLFLSSFFSYS